MARIYLGNVKGPKGDTGATGATGPQGEAATIEVGSVTTTEYGRAAQVTNVGSSSAAKFNFVIPQGKPGEKTTKMGALTLDEITTITEDFPSPAVGDVGATVFGKIVKFFADTVASLTNKIDTSKIANDFTTTDPSYVAAAPTVKALNDSLSNLVFTPFAWTMTYPNGRMYNRNYFTIVIPCMNINNHAVSVANAYTYSSGGSFIEITSAVTVDGYSTTNVICSVTFDSNQIGKLLRINFV